MRAIVLNAKDNVATALADIPAGASPHIDGPVEAKDLKVAEDIPMGHKFALRQISGEVIKYGEIIGVADRPIDPGEHVHVHNVKSRRGRGDLRKEEV
jgi:altronate dehydratase small subunit